jgi:hypothetical protein
MSSDRTSPLFRQALHVIDQSDQVILINSYPLFFHTGFETGRTKALVCLHVVQNLPAVFKPDDLVVPVFVLVAGCPHSRRNLKRSAVEEWASPRSTGLPVLHFFRELVLVTLWADDHDI